MSSSPTNAVIEIVMPQMGVSVAEGTLVEWTKRPGDWVKRDETVCVVTTDKIDVEIPSPAAGRLCKILVEPNETVAVGTPLAELDSAAKPGQAHPEEHHEEPAPRREPETDRSGFHSPIVRRMAAEHGIDLARVEGTGRGGRIRKRDLVALIESGETPEPESAPGRAQQPGRPIHIESPYRPETTAPAAPTQAGNGPTGADQIVPAERREPMSPMRKQIAAHTLASRHTAAHCTTVVEVDLARVVAARRELKEAMERRGVRLTYLAFVAAATVEALGRHPILNASIEGEEIAYHDDVNLGIAVALDDGLIVPVIRRAQRLSLEGLAAGIGELAGRARSGQLRPDDLAGGTFTITNPGQFGAVLATPIINQPQVAILDLEAVVKRPVVIGDDGVESIAIRPMTNLCMSWDHRALDGAVAARFLGEVKACLEGWQVR